MSLESHQGKTIHLATDHAGFALKEMAREWLQEAGHMVIDHGAVTYDEQDDFPDFISLAAQAVAKAPTSSVAIIFGGSGQGEAMVANRFPQVRATAYYGGDEAIIELSRTHNDANILSIGARFVAPAEAKEVISVWLNTPFTGEEKRVRRNRKLEQITKAAA